MTRKWEYQNEVWEALDAFKSDNVDEMLNELAIDGWELFKAVPITYQALFKVQYIFRRPYKDGKLTLKERLEAGLLGDD